MSNIRIEELSIGDWVCYTGKCIDGIGPNRKITYIERDTCGFLIGLDYGAFHYSSAKIEDIVPIPITPEILEKNGFKKNGEYNEWNIGTWETPYLLGVSLERPAITIKWNGSSIFIDQAKNVHQLQHAFCLAGVEKEIEV